MTALDPYVALENGRRVLHWPEIAGSTTLITRELLAEMVDELNALDAYRKATGGLPPELVAKGLHWIQRDPYGECHHYDDTPRFTDDELETLRAATFEVST